MAKSDPRFFRWFGVVVSLMAAAAFLPEALIRREDVLPAVAVIWISFATLFLAWGYYRGHQATALILFLGLVEFLGFRVGAVVAISTFCALVLFVLVLWRLLRQRDKCIMQFIKLYGGRETKRLLGIKAGIDPEIVDSLNAALFEEQMDRDDPALLIDPILEEPGRMYDDEEPRNRLYQIGFEEDDDASRN
jgi:hypothetical protein